MKSLIFGLLMAPSIVCAEGTVVFSIDSVLKEVATDVRPVFESYGIEPTIYIETSPIGTDLSLMDWGDLRFLNSIGWDIGAHSFTHPDMTTLTTEELYAEVVIPGKEIEKYIGKYPSSFSTPFGAYNEEVVSLIRKHYSAHLNAWENFGINTFPLNFDNLNRIEIMHYDFVQDICLKMEETSKNNTVVIFMLHSFVKSDPNKHQITYSVLEEILACAAKLEAEKKIMIKTVDELVKENK